MKQVTGLTTNIIRCAKRCDKCDILLDHSRYQDKKIVFCVSKKGLYICLQCAMKQNEHMKKPRVTSEELDQYLRSLINKVVK